MKIQESLFTILVEEDEVLRLHYRVIEEFGGSHGIRSIGDLKAAINAPYASFGGFELFSTELQKCCKLFCSIIQHHPFIDGNKRVGLDAFLLSLSRNQFDYTKIPSSLLFDLSMGVASSKYDYKYVYYHINRIFGIE